MTSSREDAFQLTTVAPATLAVAGVLSFDTAAAAWRAIQSALAERAVDHLDLAAVSRSDSAGLSCVLAVAAAAAARGRALHVTRMPAGMRALARVCEVESLIG